MKVFLIIVAVLVVLFAIILSLSAEATVVYENEWKTIVQFLFIKKEVDLGKILNFILFPEKAGEEAAKKNKKKSKSKKPNDKIVVKANELDDKKEETDTEENKRKPNKITKIIDEDGIVGVMNLVSNLLETAGTAATTLFRGLHIYSLYVKIIVGGGDAAEIGRAYGDICGVYYPIKGIILNGMKVDEYDDFIQADFIAPRNEYEFQLIASMNVALVLKIALKAGSKFLINLIKNK